MIGALRSRKVHSTSEGRPEPMQSSVIGGVAMIGALGSRKVYCTSEGRPELFFAIRGDWEHPPTLSIKPKTQVSTPSNLQLSNRRLHKYPHRPPLHVYTPGRLSQKLLQDISLSAIQRDFQPFSMIRLMIEAISICEFSHFTIVRVYIRYLMANIASSSTEWLDLPLHNYKHQSSKQWKRLKA